MSEPGFLDYLSPETYRSGQTSHTVAFPIDNVPDLLTRPDVNRQKKNL